MPLVDSGSVSPGGNLSISSAPPESGLEVDYDRNLTKLYQAICDCDWDVALQAVKEDPEQARTWVVRYYDEDEDDHGHQEVMWRFLPIHSACARKPPAPLISALLKAYPDGARCVDDQGMYALHYACGNQASREVIRLLLMSNSQAAKKKDPRGMLPIHFLACWGPSSVSIVDMVLVANREVATVKDDDGNTPLDLALEGDYAERDAVVGALKRWMERSTSPSSPRMQTRSPSPTPSPRVSSLNGAKQVNPPSSPRMTVKINNDQPEVVSTNRSYSMLTNETPRESSPLAERDNGRMSPVETHTVSRLRYDLSKSKSEQFGLRQECEKLSKELDATRARLRDKDDALAYMASDLSDTKKALKECKATLEEIVSERDMYQRKVASMSDRLGSLAASLSAMAEEQEKLMITVKSRTSDLSENSRMRLDKLKLLVAIEEETQSNLVGQCREDDVAIEKQMKEMDAIAAVIATMRK